MNQRPERRSRLLYHARMFAFAVLGAVALFLALIGVVWLLLSFGVWHIEDR